MKKRRIISFNKLPESLKRMFKDVYKYGYDTHVQHVKDINTNEIKKAVSLETDEAFYLILLNEPKKESNSPDFDSIVQSDLLDQSQDFSSLRS